MKREIKFRAWNEEAKRYSKKFGLTSNVLNFTDDDGLGVIKSITNEVIEQFTGLLDKNGVEIYEGDILRFPAKNKYEETTFNSFEVFFHDNDCCDSHIGWQMNRMHTNGNSAGGSIPYRMIPKHTAQLEIIGNIHTK